MIKERYNGEQFMLSENEDGSVFLFFPRGFEIYFDKEDWEEFKSEMNHVIMMDQFSPN